jgi:hypothetical protein
MIPRIWCDDDARATMSTRWRRAPCSRAPRVVEAFIPMTGFDIDAILKA